MRTRPSAVNGRGSFDLRCHSGVLFSCSDAIAPGYFADIIAVAGNPLENVTVLEDVRFVMQGGKVVKQ